MNEQFVEWTPYFSTPEAIHNYETLYNPKTKDRVVIFESMEELVECTNANFANGSWRDKSDIATNGNDSNEWIFGNDFDTLNKTDKAMSDGAMAAKYLDMVEKKKDELLSSVPRLAQLSTLAVTKRKRRRFNEDEGELDIDRYQSGDELMWVDMPRQDVKNRTARVYYNGGASGYMSTEAITKNVVTMAAIVDIISMAGIAVEVYACCCSKAPRGNARWYNVAVKAKSANEPLDISRMLTFALPGFLRQYVFGVWCNVGENGESKHWGLGTVAYQANMLPQISEPFDADFKINGANPMSETEIQIMVDDIEKFFNLGEGEKHVELQLDDSPEW